MSSSTRRIVLNECLDVCNLGAGLVEIGLEGLRGQGRVLVGNVPGRANDQFTRLGRACGLGVGSDGGAHGPGSWADQDGRPSRGSPARTSQGGRAYCPRGPWHALRRAGTGQVVWQLEAPASDFPFFCVRTTNNAGLSTQMMQQQKQASAVHNILLATTPLQTWSQHEVRRYDLFSLSCIMIRKGTVFSSMTTPIECRSVSKAGKFKNYGNNGRNDSGVHAWLVDD